VKVHLDFGEADGQELIADRAPVVSFREDVPGYYGDRTTYHHVITFCPFCGAKIVCEEVERVSSR